MKGSNVPKKYLVNSIRGKLLEFFWINVLLISCGWFLFSSFRPGKSFGIWLDNEFLISPMFNSITNQSRSHGIASYLPQYLAGLDIQGFQQFSPLYPFYFFGSSLFQTPESSIYGLNILVHFHLLIFVLGGYFLLRVLGIDRFSSSIAAVFMVFNANTLNYSTWLSVLAPYAWIPWILGALFRAFKKGTYGSWSLFYFFCCLLVFASPSQPLIHAFFLVTPIVVLEFLNARKSDPTKNFFLKNLKKCFTLSPVFIALIAPVLVPAVLSFQNQIRWIGDFPAVIGHAKIPFEAFLNTQVEFNEISNLLIPPANPREVGGLYIGIIVIALLAYGALYLRSQRLWRFFIFIGIYSLLSSFGDNFGLAFVNYEIPLINLLREPSRFLVLVHLSFAICAGLALHDLRTKSVNWLNRHLYVSEVSKVGFWRKTATMFAVFFVLSLSYSQSNWLNWKAPEVSSSEYESGNWRDLERVLQRINRLDPSSTYRVIFDGKLNTQKASMFSSFYNLRTLNTYINPLPYEQFNSIYFYNNMPIPYKELLGARFLVCEECSDQVLKSYANYDEIWRYGAFELFENSRAHGYLKVPANITYFPEGVTNFRNELERSESPVDSVFVQDNDLQSPRTLRTECKVSGISQEQFEQFSATVLCKTKAVLVLNSFNDKNWRARINGTSSIPFSVNGNLVGINLEEGTNNVQIFHKPILRNHLFRYGGIFIFVYLFLLVLLRNKARSIPIIKQKMLR